MKVFTTGQVAKICKVAPRTVSKWFDSGRLKGYRIPGSQDRRIPREYLVAFLKDHGMPLGGLDDGVYNVIVVTTDQAFVEGLAKELPHEAGFAFLGVAGGHEAMSWTESMIPACVVVDCRIDSAEASRTYEGLRRNRDFHDAALVAFVSGGAPHHDAARCAELLRTLAEARRQPA